MSKIPLLSSQEIIDSDANLKLFDKKILQIEDVAVILGFAPQTIRNWISQGKIPFIKLGRRKMFLWSRLEEWLITKEVNHGNN